MTQGVYAAEDLFYKLPVHWMWWPAIGGIFVGIGGLIFPQALGVGYDTIALLLKGNVAIHIFVGVLLVKSLIWIISLGSGTSGGVVAPILMIGAALGGVEAMFLPGFGAGFWPLISMGATLAGTMRVPFTGVIFAIELTHDLNVLLPLLVACFASYGLTVLVLKRSILTEKIARRGFHLSREYAADPLEILFVREVMSPPIQSQPGPVVTYPSEPLRAVAYQMAETGLTELPVVDPKTGLRVLGTITLADLLRARSKHLEEERTRQRVIRFGKTGPANTSSKSPPTSGVTEDVDLRV
jgi:hypothetical protein